MKFSISTRLSSHRRKSWQRHVQSVPKSAKICVLAFIVTCVLAGLHRGLGDVHDQLLKQQSTDFTSLATGQKKLPPPQVPVRWLRDSHIDNQYLFYRHLGRGKEGQTGLYQDLRERNTVVVKTYTSVARNPIPTGLLDKFAEYATTWPTEIEAGLRLSENSSSYVPIIDYFILQDKDSWSWALVTPFISFGDLPDLAKKELETHRQSSKDLDRIYRPVLIHLLESLSTLHESGLCHDDIKPDNILVQSPDHWLLGDLGNVRHIDHPWHYTKTWIRQNQWQNCRWNDIRRALKTYLLFLRSARAHIAEFDREFWTGEKEWTRLYWDFAQDVREGKEVNARQIVDLKSAAMGEEKGASHLETSIGHRSDAELAEMTGRELTCTTIPRQLWKWWWRWLIIN